MSAGKSVTFEGSETGTLISALVLLGLEQVDYSETARLLRKLGLSAAEQFLADAREERRARLDAAGGTP